MNWSVHERVENGPVVFHVGRRWWEIPDSHHVSHHLQPILHSTECHKPTFNPLIHTPVHYELLYKAIERSDLHILSFIIIHISKISYDLKIIF
jgi:hypothetical protein